MAKGAFAARHSAAQVAAVLVPYMAHNGEIGHVRECAYVETLVKGDCTCGWDVVARSLRALAPSKNNQTKEVQHA